MDQTLEYTNLLGLLCLILDFFCIMDQTLEYTDLDTLKAHAVDLDEAVREAKALDEVKHIHCRSLLPHRRSLLREAKALDEVKHTNCLYMCVCVCVCVCVCLCVCMCVCVCTYIHI
jgi:hypothetical protein